MGKRSPDAGHASTRISDIELERYALLELPASAHAKLERCIAEDLDAQARLREIRRTNQEILASYPPETVVPSIERRAYRASAERQGNTRRGFPLLVPILGALFAAAVFAIVPQPSKKPEVQTRAQLEPTRVKGQKPTLLVFLKPGLGESPRSLPDGSVVKPHALLQLAYIAAGRPHGVVLSIDGRGAVMLHHPSTAGGSSRLAIGQVVLPNAYELDDAPRFERFFFITSTAPIDPAQVMAAAQKLAADQAQAHHAKLSLQSGLEETSLLLVKEGARP